MTQVVKGTARKPRARKVVVVSPVKAPKTGEGPRVLYLYQIKAFFVKDTKSVA